MDEKWHPKENYGINLLINTLIKTLRLALWAKGVPDSKVHVANMEPTWVLSAPGGPHIGPMNLAIRDVPTYRYIMF